MTTDDKPAPTNPLSLVNTHWLHRADQRVRVILGLNESRGFIMSIPDRIEIVETVADLATLEADWERVKWMPGWFTEAEAAKVRAGSFSNRPAPGPSPTSIQAVIRKMEKHVSHPAPWSWIKGHWDMRALTDGNDRPILDAGNNDFHVKDRGVMALIAAAPEMEALLRKMVAIYDDVQKFIRLASSFLGGYPLGIGIVEESRALLARIDAAKAR